MCNHPTLNLELTTPNEGWYRCADCREKFSTRLEPFRITARRGGKRDQIIADYIDDHGITCDCCQHVMIDVTAVREGTKSHCIAGDPEGDGCACARGMQHDKEQLLQRIAAINNKETN